MQSITINPGNISGQIYPPPSKSQTLRAIVFAMLAQGKSTIYNYLPSPDTFAMIEAIKSYGVRSKIYKNKIEIWGLDGKLNPPKDFIDAQNSGIIFRFIGALAALNNTFSIITGDTSIKQNRVILPLIEGLRQLNVYAESLNNDGRAPIMVKGPIKPNKIVVDGKESQPISALLIATAFSKGPTEISVLNPGETPWIDLTLSWFHKFNIKYKKKDYSYYKIYGETKLNSFDIKIPTDFSSIAFPIVGALITKSEITLKNIDFKEEGGDKKFIDGLKKFNAKLEIDEKRKTLKVLKNQSLQAATVDINDYIDALPALSVLGCFCEGKTRIVNAHIARFKESDRIKTISTELKKMKAKIVEKEDGLVIERSNLIGTIVDSNFDHRIAMSLCIAALNAKGATTVENTQCIKKSYPTFIDDLKKLKVNFSLEER